jgi:hypothetical protein
MMLQSRDGARLYRSENCKDDASANDVCEAVDVTPCLCNEASGCILQMEKRPEAPHRWYLASSKNWK